MGMDGETDESRPKQRRIGKKEINNQIQALLKETLQEQRIEAVRKVANNVQAIETTLEEFLKSFVLLGYSFDGTPVTLVNAKTQQDADSLSTAVSRFFAKHYHNVQQ